MNNEKTSNYKGKLVVGSGGIEPPTSTVKIEKEKGGYVLYGWYFGSWFHKWFPTEIDAKNYAKKRNWTIEEERKWIREFTRRLNNPESCTKFPTSRIAMTNCVTILATTA